MSNFTLVHKADPFNSTDFTNCCGIAVLPKEDKCGKCKKTVIRSK